MLKKRGEKYWHAKSNDSVLGNESLKIQKYTLYIYDIFEIPRIFAVSQEWQEIHFYDSLQYRFYVGISGDVCIIIL